MKQYTDFLEVSPREFQPYQARGWEVIEKSIKKDFEFGESVVFLIGYPLEKAFEDTVKLLKELQRTPSYEEAWSEIMKDKGYSDEGFEEVKCPREKPTEYTTLKETDRFISTGNRDKFIEKSLFKLPDINDL